MKIISKKESLILSKEERAILLKAYEILDEIYDDSEADGDLEHYADKAKDGLNDILDESETEDGDGSGVVTIVLSL